MPLPGLQREEASAQLAASVVKEEPPGPAPPSAHPQREQGHDGMVQSAQRSANRMCV